MALIQYPELHDAEWMYEQYHEKEKSSVEISNELGCTKTSVLDNLREHGIERRSWSNELTTPLSSEAKEIIEGELLGDGCIRTRESNSETALFSYGTSREEYRDWLCNFFEKQGFKTNKMDYVDKRLGNESFKFESGAYPCLFDLYKKWYSEDGKRIPEIFDLSPLKLRHWYIGDGGYDESGEWKKVIIYNRCFSEAAKGRIQEEFDSVGMKLNIHENGNMLIPSDYHERFFEYIGPFPEEIRDVYGYKWPEYMR